MKKLVNLIVLVILLDCLKEIELDFRKAIWTEMSLDILLDYVWVICWVIEWGFLKEIE